MRRIPMWAVLAVSALVLGGVLLVAAREDGGDARGSRDEPRAGARACAAPPVSATVEQPIEVRRRATARLPLEASETEQATAVTPDGGTATATATVVARAEVQG